MATRERPRGAQESNESSDYLDDDFGFVSDADIVAFMADQEVEEEVESKKQEGFWNVQTASGIGLIGLGVLYSLQLIGLFPLGSTVLADLVRTLPILASVLIMLTGFGVLSWSPASRRRRKARERAAKIRAAAARSNARASTAGNATATIGRAAARSGQQAVDGLLKAADAAKRATEKTRDAARASRTSRTGEKRRLSKSRYDKKISGVASGIANYFGIDPTIVRIAFVIAAIFGQGTGVLLYIILSMVLPKEEFDPVSEVEAALDKGRPGRRNRQSRRSDDDDATIRIVRD